MQSVTLIVLGKLNAPFYKDAAAEYTKRLGAFCRLRVVELSEEPIAEKNASPAVVEKALEREGETILDAVPKNAALVALCIEGNQCTSEDLAGWLQQRACCGMPDVAFVIGSSHGLDGAVKAAAKKKLSMSRMTFPHQLARVMLLEQLYRAFSITAGTKYHK